MVRAYHIYNEADKEKVVQERAGGKSVKQISAEMGILCPTIYYLLKTNGDPIRGKKRFTSAIYRKPGGDYREDSFPKLRLLLKKPQALRDLYEKEGLTYKQIGERFGVSVTTVRKALKMMGVVSRLQNQRISQFQPIDPMVRERVIGEVLGDGCLPSQHGITAGYSHTSKYRTYVEWLSGVFAGGGISQVGEILKQINYSPFGRGATLTAYTYRSQSLSELQLLRDWFYVDGKKIVPSDLKLTPLVCLHWYLGDGCLENKAAARPSIALCTCDFDRDSIDYLIAELGRLGFGATHRLSNNCIGISAYSTRDFLDYIGPCPELIKDIYGYKWDYQDNRKGKGFHRFKRSILSSRTQAAYDAFIVREGG